MGKAEGFQFFCLFNSNNYVSRVTALTPCAAYLGLPIPSKLHKVLEQLHDRAEKEEGAIEEKKEGEE